jgi:hypothetical protein
MVTEIVIGVFFLGCLYGAYDWGFRKARNQFEPRPDKPEFNFGDYFNIIKKIEDAYVVPTEWAEWTDKERFDWYLENINDLEPK